VGRGEGSRPRGGRGANFAHFWRGRKTGRRVGFPNFRRKHGGRDSFRLTGSLKAHARSVTLPRIGCVRTKEATTKFRGRCARGCRRSGMADGLFEEALGQTASARACAAERCRLAERARAGAQAWQRRREHRRKFHADPGLGGRPVPRSPWQRSTHFAWRGGVSNTCGADRVSRAGANLAIDP
jgi:hypothetical protein